MLIDWRLDHTHFIARTVSESRRTVYTQVYRLEESSQIERHTVFRSLHLVLRSANPHSISQTGGDLRDSSHLAAALSEWRSSSRACAVLCGARVADRAD